MGALLKIVKDVRHMGDLPATLTDDAWLALPEDRRAVADAAFALVGPEAREPGQSDRCAAALLHKRLLAAAAGVEEYAAFLALAARARFVSAGTVVSEVTLRRTFAAARTGGRLALAPQHTGRVRQAYGWEVRAVALYNVPSKPGFADVAWQLRGEGQTSATTDRVMRYLKALPATLGDKSPARIGKHLHRLTRQKYQRRSTDELLVGEVYAGDGHTADCYVAHPNTGKPFRPELTAFIDIKARYLAGWYFTESESAVSTLYALSAAMMGHDHVPAWLYIDRGAGYRAKMLSDDATGWYAKFDIEVIGALPGNPHGKGWIERWFRTVRDKHDKHFAGGQVYCGDDMAPETNRRLSAELASGRRTLPSYYDYVASFRRFVEQYHNEPMDVLGGRTPAQLWAELTPISVGLEADAVMRPSQEATVQRQTVRLHNRFYFHESLSLYDGHRVVVEYDLHKDGRVWVHDKKGRLVCEAKLVNTIGVLPTSRLEEQRDKRLAGQVKRLERKLDEATARRADAITADDQLQGIEALARQALPAPDLCPDTPQLAATDRAADTSPVIDLLTWRND